MARFRDLWEGSVAATAVQSLKLVAVSFPDLGADTGLAVAAMSSVMDADTKGDAGKVSTGSDKERALIQRGDVDVEEAGVKKGGAALLNVWQVLESYHFSENCIFFLCFDEAIR